MYLLSTKLAVTWSNTYFLIVIPAYLATEKLNTFVWSISSSIAQWSPPVSFYTSRNKQPTTATWCQSANVRLNMKVWITMIWPPGRGFQVLFSWTLFNSPTSTYHSTTTFLKSFLTILTWHYSNSVLSMCTWMFFLPCDVLSSLLITQNLLYMVKLWVYDHTWWLSILYSRSVVKFTMPAHG